jgi:DNA (cytosine-5)-methyltransferase 1
MVPAFVQAIRDIEPYAVLMENVYGLAAIGSRRVYLAQILRELDLLGYRATWTVLNAMDYGIPQKRRRLFIVGLRDHSFAFPRPTHGPRRDCSYVTLNDVLPSSQIGTPNPSKVVYAKNPDIRPSPYDGHVFNGGGRPIDRQQPCHTILASAGGNKTHWLDDLGIVPQYHQYLAAGGAPKQGVVPGARRLTILESQIIQTFPPDLEFSGPPSSQYEQVGNAVPPKLATVLGEALLRQATRAATKENRGMVDKGLQIPLLSA